jgi:Phospholipase_D-nuclease N-terminal
MIRRPFLSVVPKAIQVWALVVVCAAVLIALVVALSTSGSGELLRILSLYGAAALVAGSAAAVWLLCVGFVFADARQRAMRPVAWVLVVILFPHLLGFLLYFVMRQPIAATCTHCGMTVPNHQPFCSWCGNSQVPPAATNPPLTGDPLPGNSLQGASQ